MANAMAQLGDSIRTTRESRGIAIRDFAADLGISPSDLVEIESGRARPSVETLLGFILTYGRVPRELYLAAIEDRELARLVALLPRLRQAYRDARSGRRRRHQARPRVAPGAPPAAAETARLQATEGALELTWDVDRVDPASLRSALDAFASKRHAGDRITLRFLKLAWAEERYEDAQGALRRIEQIQSYRRIAILPATRIHRVPLSQVGLATPLLRHAHRTFQGSDWFDGLRKGPVARYGLFFQRSHDTGRLTFSQVGARSDCARMLGRGWQREAIGTACDSAFADRRFDQRISSSYGLSLASGEARLEHIVGLIDLGTRRIWLPYQRLLLPAGDRLACFTSVTRQLACPLVAQ